VNEQSCITEDLKLLANLILHMTIVGMKFFQFAGEGVNVCGGELTRSRPLARSLRTFAFSQIPFVVSQTAQVRFAETTNGIENVQRPTPLLDGNVLEQLDLSEPGADFLRRGD